MFCTDETLAYERSRTSFELGRGMTLDDSYRLAHLPLVAPDNPRVIPRKDGTAYDMGRHPTAHSVALHIPADDLEASPAYRTLDAELRAATFGKKIAWPILERRRKRLHATICGGLGADPPVFDAVARDALAEIGTFHAEVRGLFSGNVNRGRLYLRVYPEQRAGANLFHVAQRALRRPTTDLYVVGIWNLTDDLDADETRALAGLIERWWSRKLLRIEVTGLSLLGARDDLVLDAEFGERLPLAR